MKPPILNIHDVQPIPRPPEHCPTGPAAERFGVSTAPLGRPLGAEKLGYNLTCVPPGKAAYPFHSHRQNEEMVLVVAGTGTLRLGGERFPLRVGDVVALPPGGPETAHQIINTGSEELRYLAVATRIGPEICDYPDSRKFGVYSEVAPDKDGKPQFFHFMGREAQCLDYWDGEGAKPG